MSVREKILAEIAAIPDEHLGEIQAAINDVKSDKLPSRRLGIMERLRKVTFEGPADFSENIDHYLSGEKRA